MGGNICQLCLRQRWLQITGLMQPLGTEGLLLSYCFLAAHSLVRGKTDPSDTVRGEGKQLWEYVAHPER